MHTETQAVGLHIYPSDMLSPLRDMGWASVRLCRAVLA
jgi:hypothetical protein